MTRVGHQPWVMLRRLELQSDSRGVPGQAFVPDALHGGSDGGSGKNPLSASLGCALRRLGLRVRARRDVLVSGRAGLGTAYNRGQHRQAARETPRCMCSPTRSTPGLWDRGLCCDHGGRRLHPRRDRDRGGLSHKRAEPLTESLPRRRTSFSRFPAAPRRCAPTAGKARRARSASSRR